MKYDDDDNNDDDDDDDNNDDDDDISSFLGLTFHLLIGPYKLDFRTLQFPGRKFI